ncbi:MAG: hypothetical protein JO212_18325 [Acetobacteraceae bacterium]|nr:hypothetical protein [Acetobacteraceae bacterium]
MKNTTYADQSGTIRTLTEEEVTVVSGGAQSWQAINNRILAEARLFRSRPRGYYVPPHPTRNDFVAVNGML